MPHKNLISKVYRGFHSRYSLDFVLKFSMSCPTVQKNGQFEQWTQVHHENKYNSAVWPTIQSFILNHWQISENCVVFMVKFWLYSLFHWITVNTGILHVKENIIETQKHVF